MTGSEVTESDRFPSASEAEWRGAGDRSGRVPLSSLTVAFRRRAGRSARSIRLATALPSPAARPARAGPRCSGSTAATPRPSMARSSLGDHGRRHRDRPGLCRQRHRARPWHRARSGNACPDLQPMRRSPGCHVRIEAGRSESGAGGRPRPDSRADRRQRHLPRLRPDRDACRARLPGAPCRGPSGRPRCRSRRAMDDAGIDGEAIVADGRPWHDAGATEAQELAAVLARPVAWLRAAEDARAGPRRVARRLGVILSADADQFLTIAKFRAAPHAARPGVGTLRTSPPRRSGVHAETSWRMISRRDPLPEHAARDRRRFRRRRRRRRLRSRCCPSTSTATPSPTAWPATSRPIALDEAALFRVGDPGAGSGAIEALTAELAEAAWDEFRAIEAEGGLLAAVRSGALQARIAAKREERLATGGAPGDRNRRRQHPHRP